MDEIDHDVASEAAATIINTVDLTACKATLFGQLLFIIKAAMGEAERQKQDNRMKCFLCLGCYRSLNVPPGNEGVRVKCPACGKKQRLPERVPSN